MFEHLACAWGCKTDTVVTVFVTLSVFTIGIIINIIINNIRIFKERRRYRKYFHTLIKNLRKYSLKQSNELDKSVVKFTMKNQESYFVIQLTENSLNLIDKISFEKIYDSFFVGLTCKDTLRMKALNCMLNQSALLKTINSNIRTDIESLDKKFHDYEQVWNDNVDSIRKVFDNLRQQNASGTIKKEFIPLLKDLDKIISEWSHQPDRAHRVIVRQFIVDKLNSNFFESHKALDLATMIQNYNIDAIMSYSNMENILELYANLFKSYSRLHRNCNRIVGLSQRILTRTALIK
jgi:hypothetical protein